ncbi:MAG: hypothetical protein ACJA0C_000729 [Candidatus Endobugula sp.]|jgi:hypothetical protein
MTHYTQYLKHHVDLLQAFSDSAQQTTPFTQPDLNNEDEAAFIATLKKLCEMPEYNDDMNEKGQWFVSRVVSAYSHLMPLLNRDLLWFFGGNCLHYMPDDEISFYQQLEELRFSAEDAGHDFDYAAAKQSLAQTY